MASATGMGRVLAQPLLLGDEVLKPAQQLHTTVRAAGGRSWQGRLLAWGLLTLCCLGILGFLYIISSTDNSQLLTVYNAGLDSSLALKATLLDTAVLWTGNSLTAQQVLFSVVPTAAALVVVTPGPSSPVRRAPHQPFLSVSPEVPLPADTINTAVGAVEAVLGRQLFPISISMVDMAAQRTSTAGGVRPYVVWEVGSGTVLVDKYLVTQAWANPKVQHMSGLLAEHLFKALAHALSTAGEVQLAGWAAGSLHDSLPGLMGPALSMAVAAAFAAAPPLWFCIVCPAVLGLLAPLLINIGLNQLAGYLCTHMSLPDDQCFDLMLGALGLGFVLALASAIPIFYVCKLAECAHRNGTGGVQRLQSGMQLHLTSKLRRHAAA